MTIQQGVAILMMSAMMTASAQEKQPAAPEQAKFYSFTMKTIDGGKRSLGDYRGKVVLVVNVASKCGYTPQYKGLEALYEKYKDKGLVILGFPANNFLWQEPASDAEIQQFCSTTYNVTFDMFSKISVKGDDKDPLYVYLTKESPFPGEVKWNFQKYLVDRQGNVTARYSSGTEPLSDEVIAKIEELLQKKS